MAGELAVGETRERCPRCDGTEFRRTKRHYEGWAVVCCRCSWDLADRWPLPKVVIVRREA